MHHIETSLLPSGYARWVENIIHNVKNAVHGWKLYFTHPVCSAGLALATLFMTVLGVDNITYGFCMSQCITKSILGGLLGLTAIIGILGSLTFPVLRKRFGLHRTGLIGFISLISMLTLCVVSIGLEGSPFDPYFFQTQDVTNDRVNIILGNISINRLEVSRFSVQNQIEKMDTAVWENSVEYSDTYDRHDMSCYVPSFLSVSVFLSGIILARFGLWISDLTITQTLQVS